MRSIDEIAFRARQEFTNLYLFAAKPSYRPRSEAVPFLPDAKKTAAALSGSSYAEGVLATAQQILKHRIPLLGVEIDTGTPIRWCYDYAHHRESAPAYFRRIKYLDFDKVGDHKFIWELNRHQHLVLLAQAFVLTGNTEYTREIFAELESWSSQNSFQCGINWASALEVAFRALSWIWVYHLVGSEMTGHARQSFLISLYRHALHLEANLSIYFSPNTHLLGEAVALYTIARFFPDMPGAGGWQQRSYEIVNAQLAFQVKPDGSHFEQSTYYHVYALDFFLWFYLVAGRPRHFQPVLERMAEYLFWLLGSNRKIAFFGDDDGGRLFHPYGARDEFGRSTLATCGILFGRDEWLGSRGDVAQQAAWWIGHEALNHTKEVSGRPSGNRLFPDCGALFLQNPNLFVQMDCGPFGYGGAGHSHSDSLSLCLTHHGQKVLIDPGTYTYVGDPEKRNWFRGSAAHNTVSVDDTDQGTPAGPFRWASKPEVELAGWSELAGGGLADATCRSSGYTHRRQILLREESLLILDEISGPPGEHKSQQSWHFGAEPHLELQLSCSAPAVNQPSPYSPAYGALATGAAAIARVSGTFPHRIATLFHPEPQEISVEKASRLIEACNTSVPFSR